jgi:glutamate dehydrogenase
VSVLVFVLCDHYDSTVREKIGIYSRPSSKGAFQPIIPRFLAADWHVSTSSSVALASGITPEDIVRKWVDGLREIATAKGSPPAFIEIASHFPQNYQNSFSPTTALIDAERVSALTAANPIVIDCYRDAGQTSEQASLEIYHFGAPVALSRRVPLLENMGFRVISERTFELGKKGEDQIFIHDMELENAYGKPVDLGDGGALFEEVFLSV